MGLINGSGQTRPNLIVGIMDGVVGAWSGYAYGLPSGWESRASGTAASLPVHALLIGGAYYLSGKWKVQKAHYTLRYIKNPVRIYG